MNTSISTTDLNVRTKNALHGAGIHTVEQLKATPIEQLKRIRNMGKKCLADIEDFLQEDEDSQPLMASQATLRDYFAAKALQGMMSNKMYGEHLMNALAQTSYIIADAMLKAREQ